MIPFIPFVVALLTMNFVAAQFILRNQLDPVILTRLNGVEKQLSNDFLHNAENSMLSSLSVMELKPLYFHIDDLAIQVNNMHLTSSDFIMEETNMDVLGQRMMPIVYLQWIEVNGKIKTSQGSNLPQICFFRLVQNHLKGQGVLSLTVDLTQVLWSYFHFKPKYSSFEVKGSEGSMDSNILKRINSSEFSELFYKKIKRDISDQLNKVISKNINQTLKTVSKFSTLEPYSEDISAIGINNTENANSFIDSLLKIGGALIRGKYGDHIKIPDIQEGFSEKFLIKFRGSFRATEGSAIGISSVHRVGDVVFGYDNDTLLHFYGILGFDSLHLYYDYYKAEMWGVGPSGTLDTILSPLSVLVHVHLNTSSKIITLEKFKISNVGDLQVSLSGLGGMFNWLVSRVTTWVVGIYRDEVLQLLESQYEQYGNEVFATYSIEELLNGGKNEAYVL